MSYEAIQLFVERASEVNSNFHVTPCRLAGYSSLAKYFVVSGRVMDNKVGAIRGNSNETGVGARSMKKVARIYPCDLLVRAGAGLEPATFGLCNSLQLSLPDSDQFVIWTFSSSFFYERMPAVKSLHLPQ